MPASVCSPGLNHRLHSLTRISKPGWIYGDVTQSLQTEGGPKQQSPGLTRTQQHGLQTGDWLAVAAFQPPELNLVQQGQRLAAQEGWTGRMVNVFGDRPSSTDVTYRITLYSSANVWAESQPPSPSTKHMIRIQGGLIPGWLRPAEPGVADPVATRRSASASAAWRGSSKCCFGACVPSSVGLCISVTDHFAGTAGGC